MNRSMKTFSALALVVGLTATAYSQAPFTIVSPKNGATVREVVEVAMPDGSVPQGTFIGVMVDDKFIEATVPVQVKDRLVYRLDTKGRAIPDGQHTLTIRLYGNVGGKPAVVEESSVQVKVGNHEGFNIPEDGTYVHYKFTPGRKIAYTVEIGQLVSTLSEARNRIGGRAAELPVAFEKIRVLIACDDRKADGSGLIRTQILPYAGKDYVVATVEGEEKPTKRHEAEFAPIYRLLTKAGREVYADAPAWYGIDGFVGRDSLTDLFVMIPLPLLPEDKVKVGSTWRSQILFPVGSLEEARESGKTAVGIVASGRLVNFEWEQGKRCAKIHYELAIAEGSRETPTLRMQGREFKNDRRTSYEQDVWVSLDEGVLVRQDFRIQADFKVEQPSAGQTPGGRTGPQIGGGPPGTGGGGSVGSPSIDLYSPAGGQRRGGPSMGGGAPQGGGPQVGGGPAAGGRQGGGATFVRQTLYVRMTMEK